MRELHRSDRGASVFMLAITLFLLIGASAIAVDIAAIWLDRSTDQKVTDVAAAAGAVEAWHEGGQAACATALTYVAVNTADLDPSDIDLSNCVNFVGSCDVGEPVWEEEFVAGRYNITVVYPIDQDHDLMTTRTIGRHPQDFHPDDGDDCERVGVKMQSTRNSLFAQVLGFGSGTTTVHSVARHFEGDERPPFNLLVLDRTGCRTIVSSGGGKIIAEPPFAIDGSGLAPGLIAADSNGADCSGSQTVIDVGGSGALLRADGPAGCGNGLEYSFGGFPAGTGCGKISVFAEGPPGCNPVACDVSGGGNEPNPEPTPLGRRYTRQLADHEWNCYTDYTWSSGSPFGIGNWATDPLTGNQSIGTCDKGTDPYIYQLISRVGQSGEPNTPGKDWIFWSAVYGCDPFDEVETVNENVVIDCNSLQVQGDLTINGNVVVNRNLRIPGKLTINPPADDPWVFFRGGELRKGGNGELRLNNAMVYMAKGSQVTLVGGSGPLSWSAPTDGDFRSLALWSDSENVHSWAGQAALDLIGIFFMPQGTASYSGSGHQIQSEAQWIAWRLEVTGGAELRIAPPFGFALTLADPRTYLIR